MYPNKVYHCPCVSLEIKLCLVNGHYSVKDICKKLNQSIDDIKIYCCKCGDGLQDVIFSCVDHMKLIILSCENDGTFVELTQKDKNSCKICIKRYLQTACECCYDHTKFDIPIAIKKQKKVLCLRLKKCDIK